MINITNYQRNANQNYMRDHIIPVRKEKETFLNIKTECVWSLILCSSPQLIKLLLWVIRHVWLNLHTKFPGHLSEEAMPTSKRTEWHHFLPWQTLYSKVHMSLLPLRLPACIRRLMTADPPTLHPAPIGGSQQFVIVYILDFHSFNQKSCGYFKKGVGWRNENPGV